jgi:hypothetical protein
LPVFFANRRTGLTTGFVKSAPRGPSTPSAWRE